LHFLPSIIRMIKSRMRWIWHVARTGKRGMRIGFWWVKPEGKRLLEILRRRWKIILKWFLERLGRVVWTAIEKFISNWATGLFWRRELSLPLSLSLSLSLSIYIYIYIYTHGEQFSM
jgi:hypothetical protein